MRLDWKSLEVSRVIGKHTQMFVQFEKYMLSHTLYARYLILYNSILGLQQSLFIIYATPANRQLNQTSTLNYANKL